MAKTIIREIIISLLLCLAIILVLGVLLYKFVPNNKAMPEKVSYVTPENIKEELSSTEGVNENDVILTYEVDATDLDNYQKIKDYKPGKTNPFSSYVVDETNTSDENTTSSDNNNSQNNNNQNNNSEKTSNPNTGNNQSGSNTNKGYFQDKGLK